MNHLQNIQQDIDWLSEIIGERIKNINFHFESLLPVETGSGNVYANFINEHSLGIYERLLIILTLVPHLHPVLLYEKFNASYSKKVNSHNYNVRCPEFNSGIIKSAGSDSFLPTGHTFLYLVAGNNLAKRSELITNISEGNYVTIAQNIISPIQNNAYDPLLSNLLMMEHNFALAFISDNEKYIHVNPTIKNPIKTES